MAPLRSRRLFFVKVIERAYELLTGRHFSRTVTANSVDEAGGPAGASLQFIKLCPKPLERRLTDHQSDDVIRQLGITDLFPLAELESE
jgi:hypothetical protein